MALAVRSFTANSNWFSTGPKSVSVSWLTGDVIVVFAAMEAANQSIDTPTATGLTFTAQSTSDAASPGEAEARMWTATAAADGTNVTVQITGSSPGTHQLGLAVWVISGGPSSIAGSTGNNTESAFSITTTAGDLVIAGLSDFNATNPPGKTPATGSGTATERFDTGNGSNYAVWGAEWVGTSAGTFTFGPNNYTSLQVAQVAVRLVAPAGATNANATGSAVAVSAPAPTASVRPGGGAGAVAVTGQPAIGQVGPGATSAAVSVTAPAPSISVTFTATVAPVTVAAPSPVAQVRAQAGVAAVGVTGLAASSTASASAGSAPIGAAASAAAVTVAPQAGVSAVGIVASNATVSTSSTTNANAGVAAVGVAGQNATVSTPTLRVLQTYALSSADPHSLTIPGATAGRDLWLIVNTAAVVTTPSGWTDEADRVATMASYIFRLDGASNPGGSIGVTLDLSAARAVAAVAVEAKTVAAGTIYASLIAPINAPGSTAWGTGAHTFTQRDDVLAIYCLHSSTTPPTFAVSSYDQGFDALADTGWAGAGGFGDEAARVLVGYEPEIGFTAGGVVVTLDAAGPSGSAVGFLAFDESSATIATVANVAVTAGTASATVRGPATSGPVTVAAQAPLATVAPQAGQGAVTLTGRPATTTVRAQAGVAAVAAQGQAATVNTSSSTNANAGVAAVGVTASAAAASVRPAAASAPVGAAGLFDAGSEVVLQLVMDNPVAITVTASNATVSTAASTNAPATVAPVTVAAPSPVAQVRAQAGVAAVGVAAATAAATVRPAAGAAAVAVAALQPAVSTSNQVLAQAGVAAVAVAATGASSAVRPAAGSAPVATAGLGAIGQVAARPGGAALTIAALVILAQARASAASAPVAVAGRSPVMGGVGAAWWIWRAGALVRHRALLGGVHPTTVDVT